MKSESQKKDKPGKIEHVDIAQGKFFITNPSLLSLLWSAILVFGGIIFILYFVDVGYFPELDFASATYLLATVAFTGMFVLAWLCAAIVLPGYIWYGLLQEQSAQKETSNDSDKKVPKEVLTQYILPAGALAGLSWVYFFWEHLVKAAWYQYWISGFFLTIGLVFAYLVKKSGDARRKEGSPNGYLWVLKLMALVVFFAAWFVFVILIVQARSEFLDVVMNSFSALLLLLMTNLLIANPPKGLIGTNNSCLKHGICRSFAIAAICLVFLFAIGHIWPVIPNAIMRNYKLGGAVDVCLIVSSNGKAVFAATTDGSTSIVVESDNGSRDLWRVNNVKLLSRIGQDWLFVSDDNKIRFTIPKKDIVSLIFMQGEKGGSSDYSNRNSSTPSGDL